MNDVRPDSLLRLWHYINRLLTQKVQVAESDDFRK